MLFKKWITAVSCGSEIEKMGKKSKLCQPSSFNGNGLFLYPNFRDYFVMHTLLTYKNIRNMAPH